MILGRGTTQDRQTSLLIGLSHKNLEYLRAGKPIVLDAEKYPAIPPDIHIVLFAGKTEDSMAAMLRKGGIVLNPGDTKADTALGAEDGSS